MRCCSDMEDRIRDETAICYIPKFREYGVRVLDGGSSFIVLRFCPWCGAVLPKSLRDRWFVALEGLGLDPHGDDVPAGFLSDEWWTG
jgi:hypothetical protein